MLNIVGLSHICVNVDSIDEAVVYYAELLNAEPSQVFPKFKSTGFARSAGFVANPEDVEVSIAFVGLPNGALTVELMQYHAPQGQVLSFDLATTDQRRLGHVAVKVTKIDESFAHFSAMKDTRMISSAPEYRPVLIGELMPGEFRFYDPSVEDDVAKKAETARIIAETRFFYFVDRYGIQWECEQGHDDIGDPPV